MRQLAFTFTAPERWRDIPGYEGLYRISDEGRVQHAACRGGRDGKRYKPGMLKRASPNADGYMDIRLTGEPGKDKHHFVHRLVMEAFCPCAEMIDLDVNHRDGVKANNSLTNLEWMTHQQNIIHARTVLNAWATSQPRGERSRRSNLKDADIREIRRLWRNGNGMQQKQIAPLFGVSHVAIHHIVYRKTWAHVE